MTKKDITAVNKAIDKLNETLELMRRVETGEGLTEKQKGKLLVKAQVKLDKGLSLAESVWYGLCAEVNAD